MKYIFFYLIVFSIISTSSCKKDDTTEVEDPKSSLLKISETYAIGSAAKVELWSNTELSTGYQNLFVALYDSVTNKSISTATVQIMPMMEMNMNGMKMSHSAPFESPESINSINSLFPCSAVFTMPSNGTDGIWRMKIMVKKEGQSKFGIANMPITVKQSTPERVRNITAVDGTKLTIAYILPSKPKVGVNDFEISIHRKQDMMTFPAEDSYSIVMTPEMPSMGHGSPNNINPLHIKNGHYKGKVNFTMTGDWKINLELKKDGETSSTFFDLLF